jgi:RimJ/RimL family protein N-acetyltransferase
LVVEEKATGGFLGETGFADWRRGIVPPIVGIPEVGWVFTARAHGKGYATEAATAVLAWGDAHFGKIRTVCLINPANTASLRVAAKCGYIEETRTVFNGHSVVVLARL